jgi:hypothetical protein
MYEVFEILMSVSRKGWSGFTQAGRFNDNLSTNRRGNRCLFE